MDSTRVPPQAESHTPKIAEMAAADAAVAILHARGPAESVLLIRRTERENDPWSGHWSFPGGRRALEDRDLLDTALRELEEECGIHLAREQLTAALPAALARRRVGKFLLVAPFLFRVDGERLAVLDPREAAEALWVRLSVLRDPARHTLRAVPGLPPEVWFPAIELPGPPLWGFTYRLIAEWLELNPRDDTPEAAGFQAAREILDLLLSHGLTLARGWEECEGAHVAEVKGEIPVALVRDAVSRPADHIPRVNMLEVRPDFIRVVGLAFEEYLIRASG